MIFRKLGKFGKTELPFSRLERFVENGLFFCQGLRNIGKTELPFPGLKSLGKMAF